MVIKPRCPNCGKLVEVERESIIGNKQFLKLTCNHTIIKPYFQVKKSDLELYLDSVVSSDGKRLRDYQRKGIEFGVKANGRVLIADDMGLGKTIQDFCIVDYLNLYPCLVVCKARLRDQLAHEYVRWIGTSKAIPNIIEEPRYEKPYPDILKLTIISFDSLNRSEWINDEELLGKFNSLIIDETQQIKNTDAARTAAVMKVSKYIPHVIGSSGTPIKNNAAEYFPILNILKPERFPNKDRFTYTFVNTKANGYGFGGLMPHSEELFRDMTKDFIIRRRREDVAPELPTIDRQYTYFALGKEVDEAYQRLVKNFMEEMERIGHDTELAKVAFGPGSNLLAWMGKMRHLTGVAKVEPTLAYIEEFLLTTNKKLVIFCHHHDVANLLMLKLSEQCKAGGIDVSINLMGQKAEETFEKVELFKNDANKRILICSTIAHGEGLNLQFCDTAIIMEREWNPANEEQAEARFPRLGSTASKIIIQYPVALETIDEFLAAMVEEKRSYMDQVLDGKASKWTDSNLMKELADKIYQMGLKKFSLKGKK